MDNLLSVGKILNFHGTQGEVKVGYTQGKEEQLCSVKEFFIERGTKTIKLIPENIRFHKNTALIKFKEINSLNEAVELKGIFIKAPKDTLEKFLEDDEFYVDDLAGVDVYSTEGDFVGVVDYVVSREHEDMLVIKKDTEGKEFYVPFVKELVPEVSLAENKIVINGIPGLIEETEAETDTKDEI